MKTILYGSEYWAPNHWKTCTFLVLTIHWGGLIILTHNIPQLLLFRNCFLTFQSSHRHFLRLLAVLESLPPWLRGPFERLPPGPLRTWVYRGPPWVWDSQINLSFLVLSYFDKLWHAIYWTLLFTCTYVYIYIYVRETFLYYLTPLLIFIILKYKKIKKIKIYFLYFLYLPEASKRK